MQGFHHAMQQIEQNPLKKSAFHRDYVRNDPVLSHFTLGQHCPHADLATGTKQIQSENHAWERSP